MMTENLNEMIQQDSSNPVDLSDPDFTYTLPSKKLTYDKVKSDALNAEEPTTESTIPQVGIIEQNDTAEVSINNYQSVSEEALIAYATSIHKKVQTASIAGYWEIGRTINSFYQGTYGTRELERISKATGIGRDTLNKMCKFAKQYSRDQVESLLSGAFLVSWFQISQNLSVEPEKLIRVYHETGDTKQFHNDIMKFKGPQESKGKSKSDSIAAPAVVSEPAITNGVVEVPILNEAPFEKAATITEIQVPDDHVKQIDDLLSENAKLREDLARNEHRVNKLQELHDDSLEGLCKNIELSEKLRTTLKKVYNMIQRKCDHADILSQIDWRMLE